MLKSSIFARVQFVSMTPHWFSIQRAKIRLSLQMITLFQRLPERQPGAQAVSRVTEGKAQRPLTRASTWLQWGRWWNR